MPIRVLIVDDSALMRRALTALLASDPEIEVVGTARDGQAAIEQVAALRPDVITMDVRMPVLDGLQTTEHIMAYYPTPILVVTASLSRFDIDITFRMLGLGALDVMEKPSSDDPNGLQQARTELIRRVKMLSRVRVVTHLRGRRRSAEDSQTQNDSDAAKQLRRTRGSRPLGGTGLLRRAREAKALPGNDKATPNSSQPVTSDPRRTRGSRLLSNAPSTRRTSGLRPIDPPEIVRPTRGSRPLQTPAGPTPQTRLTSLGGAAQLVVIGASTGGPRVVQQVLRDLPPNFPAAVLVVQHIADGFTRGMVDWLAESCRIPIHLGQSGDVARPGHVYVAPDNLHLLINSDGILSLSSQPAIIQRPSVDVTMQRAAEAYGSQTIGVLLTGMGRDGASGMAAIYRTGGYTIAQSGETCVVFGMPKAAIEAQVVHDVLGPDAIGGRMMMLLRDSFTKERR